MVPELSILLAYMAAMIVHELAHYAVARWYGVWVERVMIGWDLGGVPLVSYDHRGTVFGIGWVPVLSYVKLSGQERADLGDESRRPGRGYEVQDRTGDERTAIEMAGIWANLVMVAFAMGYGPEPGSWMMHLMITSAFLALYNLAPIGMTDGGRVFTRIATAYSLSPRTTGVVRLALVCLMALTFLCFLSGWVW